MTGSGLAQLIIPIAGTLFLTAWLAVVFYAGRRPWHAGGSPAPAHESPGPAALTARARGHVIRMPAPPEAQEDLLAASRDRENLRARFEVKR